MFHDSFFIRRLPSMQVPRALRGARVLSVVSSRHLGARKARSPTMYQSLDHSTHDGGADRIPEELDFLAPCSMFQFIRVRESHRLFQLRDLEHAHFMTVSVPPNISDTVNSGNSSNGHIQ